MKPYFQDGDVVIYHGDCREILPQVRNEAVVVSDPPFNVGYHYASYTDNLPDGDYRELVRAALKPPSVVIHYPEAMFYVCDWLGEPPAKCAAWTYNANTPRQWRMVSWFGLLPDFSLVKQPYRNPEDKRVAALIAAGAEGCDLYDWWHDQQVKNISAEKTEHPCQMPESVMRKVVGVTPAQAIVDPFMGSGTTLVAARYFGKAAIGIELDERYCEIAAKRFSQQVLPLGGDIAPTSARA